MRSPAAAVLGCVLLTSLLVSGCNRPPAPPPRSADVVLSVPGMT